MASSGICFVIFEGNINSARINMENAYKQYASYRPPSSFCYCTVDPAVLGSMLHVSSSICGMKNSDIFEFSLFDTIYCKAKN